MASLLDEGGDFLLDEGDAFLLDETPDAASDASVEVGTDYSIDLCVGWVRVAECVDGVFDGVIRNLAAGEWRLTGATDALAFGGGYELADIDTIRVVKGAAIVFAGYVTPVTSGVGGLEVVKDASGDKFTLTGSDGWTVLASRLAYPSPFTDPPWANPWDVRTGIASSVAASYVLVNAGNAATASRQIPGLVVINGSTGLSGSWSARLQPLDQLVARICREGGITCRLVTSYTGALTVTLTSAADRRATVVLSDQGDLLRIQIVTVPESTTYVVAGGQGLLTSRTFATAGATTGVARREVFSNQSSLSTVAELQQSANATLASAAATITVRAEATDDAAARFQYLSDYDIGDTIAAEIEDVRYPAVVESVTVHIDPSRAVIRPVLGDASPDLVTGLIRDVAGLQSRFDTQIA